MFRLLTSRKDISLRDAKIQVAVHSSVASTLFPIEDHGSAGCRYQLPNVICASSISQKVNSDFYISNKSTGTLDHLDFQILLIHYQLWSPYQKEINIFIHIVLIMMTSELLSLKGDL